MGIFWSHHAAYHTIFLLGLPQRGCLSSAVIHGSRMMAARSTKHRQTLVLNGRKKRLYLCMHVYLSARKPFREALQEAFLYNLRGISLRAHS